MSEIINSIAGLPTPFNMIVLIVLIGSTAGVIGTIAKETRKFFCHRSEMELKREMLDRGIDPIEIEQVRQGDGEVEHDGRPIPVTIWSVSTSAMPGITATTRYSADGYMIDEIAPPYMAP